MSASTDWKKLFERLARLLRKEFSSRFPFKDDGDVSPELLSIRDGIHAFPFPAHVLRLDLTGVKTQFHEADDTWTIVRYDIAQKNTNQPQFHGVVAFSEIASQYSLLETVFDIFEPGELFKDPRPTSIWDAQHDKFVTQVIPYDIESRLAQYAAEFHRFLVDSLVNSLSGNSPERRISIRNTDSPRTRFWMRALCCRFTKLHRCL